MFVLLFAYVFAGSLGGAAYREFLIGGNLRANRGVQCRVHHHGAGQRPAQWHYRLFANTVPATFSPPGGWPGEHSVLYAVLSAAAIIAVFAPLTVVRYRRLARR
jgi:hypothetical protein